LRYAFIGNVTFKRSKSGCRHTCYLHIFGFPIVRGIENGCGYDTASAAFIKAWEKFLALPEINNLGSLQFLENKHAGITGNITKAVHAMESGGWQRELETVAGVFAAHIGG
jgi:hypothetical protein